MIENFYDSWENSGFQDIEDAIKAKVADIEGGQFTRIQVSIVGSTIRSLISTAEVVTFKYKVDNQVNSEYDPNFSVYLQIGSRAYDITPATPPSSAEDEIETPNIASYLALVGGEQIECAITAYTETNSATRIIKYNRRNATLTTSNTIANINPNTLYYNAAFSGQSATLSVDFYGTSGTIDSENKTTVTKDINVGGQVTIGVPNLQAGAHVVKAVLILEDGETESNEVVTSIIVSTGAQTGDCYITTEPITSAVQNSYIDLKYCVYAVDLQQFENVKVTLQTQNPATSQYETVSTVVVPNGTINTWNYFIPYEVNRLKILVKSSDNEHISSNVYTNLYIAAEATNIGWEAKPNPVFHFSARGHTNNDEHPESWVDGRYSMGFYDMQWDGYGSGWRSNHLHLSGNSYCYIDNFYPFFDDTTFIEGSRGGGLLASGFALKLRYRVTNVSNPDEKIIQCYSEDDSVGFYITGNAIFIDFKQKLTSDPKENQAKAQHNARHFCENTIMDVLITCQPYYSQSGETKHMLCYYVNGEIGGFAKLTDTTLTQNLNNKTLLKFGGSGAQLDLYDVRFYKGYATSFEALQTHTMDLDSAQDIRKEFDKNNFYELGGDGNPYLSISQAIAYGKYLAKQGRTNYGVVVSTDLCNSSEFIGSTSYWNSTDPQSVYIYRFKQDTNGNGIIDPDLTKWFEGDAGTIRMRRQGTSTADATKGNVRIDTQGTVKVHTWNEEAQVFNSEYTTVGKKAKIWQIPDADAIPCYLLTMKKNPNESTQARNLPTAKMYEDASRYLAGINVSTSGGVDYAYEDLLTPPQREELAEIAIEHPLWSREEQIAAIKTRQCVDGIPSIAFEIHRVTEPTYKTNPEIIPNSDVLFGGQFDLITDKTNMEVFGFSGNDTFSIEFRNNQSAVCNFHTTDLTNAGTKTPSGEEGSNHLEYRYPDIDAVGGDWEQSVEHPNGKASIGLGFDGPMQKLFDFVYNCSPFNIGTESVNGVISDNNDIITINGVQYADNEGNRLNKFRYEANNHVVVNQMIFNGLMILSGLMVDQDVKNQFWTYFDSEHEYDKVNGNKLIRLMGYDFDSSWGMDNDNFFRFLYNVLYSDGLYDGKHDGRSTDFWYLMFAVFKDEMALMNKRLHAGGFMRKNNVLKYMHDNQVDIYNAMIYNANSEYSYLEGESDYQKAHGSAKEHNEWFVEGRMHFMSGMTFNDTSDACDFNGGVAGGDESTNNIAYFNVAEYSNLDAANRYFNQKNQDESDHLWEILVTGYERTYAALRVDNTIQGGNNKTKLIEVTTSYDNDGLPISVNRQIVSFKTDENYRGQADTRFRIYGGKHLKTIDGLHRWYISRINNWGDLVNLEELKLGYYGQVSDDQGNTSYYNNPVLNSLGISENIVFGSCKKLDLAGCSNMSSNVDLRKFPILEEFDGRNMDKTPSITLPSGSSMKKIHYPANCTTIEIRNKPNINTISLQGHDKIQNVVCVGSSNVAAMAFIGILVDLNQNGTTLNYLTSFTLDGGTSDNPLVLTPQQVSGLINLSNKENCTSDISGYINTTSGTMLRYQKYLLNQAYPNLHVLATEEADSYSVTFPNGGESDTLAEGNTIKLTANNISINTLKFRLTHNPVGIGQAIVQERIRIVGDVVVCDAPQENLTWTDSVTIEVCPVYSDFDPIDTKVLYLTVTAVRLNNIQLNYTDELGVFTMTQIYVDTYPENCTKGNGLTIEATSSNDQSFPEIQPTVNGRTIAYTTPGGICTATVQVKAYLYGDKTSPVDTKNATIDIVKPAIRAIVRIDGTTASGYPLKVTDPNENIHLLENGEVLETIVGQQYTISADNVQGYDKALSANTITALNGVVTVYLDYTTKQPDVYVVYSDNTYEEIDRVIDRGALYTGKTLEAFCVDSELCTVTYNVNNEYRATIFRNFNGSSGPPRMSGEPSLSWYSGIGIQSWGEYGNPQVRRYTWTIINNGESQTLTSYSGAPGEVVQFFNNVAKINTVLRLNDLGSLTRMRILLPYARDDVFVWRLDPDNTFVAENAQREGYLLALYNWTPRKGTKLD